MNTTKQMANAVFLPEVIRMIDEGHSVTIPLRGYSMRPFLEDRRDKAILEKAGNIGVGDAVLAEITPGHFVLHRIVSIDGEDITLRGDGNIATERCRREDVKALATGFYRKGRKTPDMTCGRKWAVYSWIWTRLYPIRRYLLFGYRLLLKIEKAV